MCVHVHVRSQNHIQLKTEIWNSTDCSYEVDNVTRSSQAETKGFSILDWFHNNRTCQNPANSTIYTCKITVDYTTI